VNKPTRSDKIQRLIGQLDALKEVLRVTTGIMNDVRDTMISLDLDTNLNLEDKLKGTKNRMELNETDVSVVRGWLLSVKEDKQ